MACGLLTLTWGIKWESQSIDSSTTWGNQVSVIQFTGFISNFFYLIAFDTLLKY